MKRIVAGLFLTGLVAAVGCDKGGTAGGPGVTNSASKPPLLGQADDTFKITTSAMTVSQGDTVPGSVGIKRGTNFAQDVGLAFSELPKGVTIEPAAPVLKAQATEATFSVKVADDAAPGETTVKVIGHPGKGGDATNEFKLTIAKKDTFTLSMPFWTTALKQGETKAVTVTINRDKRFDQDVTLKIDGLPKGVSVEPATLGIKNGESEVKFSLKAADDAPVGDFAVQVAGHPAKGADAMKEFKFAIAKK